MTWEALLALDLVGRDISFYAMEPAYYEARGPIAEVIDLRAHSDRLAPENSVEVRCLWRNKRRVGGEAWVSGEDLGTTMLSMSFEIRTLHGDRIAITYGGALVALIHAPEDHIERVA